MKMGQKMKIVSPKGGRGMCRILRTSPHAGLTASASTYVKWDDNLHDYEARIQKQAPSPQHMAMPPASPQISNPQAAQVPGEISAWLCLFFNTEFFHLE